MPVKLRYPLRAAGPSLYASLASLTDVFGPSIYPRSLYLSSVPLSISRSLYLSLGPSMSLRSLYVGRSLYVLYAGR
jgi:hypothetical protein